MFVNHALWSVDSVFCTVLNTVDSYCRLSSTMCLQHVYRASFLSENMIYDIVRTLKSEHVELEKNAASALFQVGP